MCVSLGSRPALDRTLAHRGRDFLLKTRSFEVQTRCFQASQFLIICADSSGTGRRATLSVLDISFTNREWVLLICEKMSRSS